MARPDVAGGVRQARCRMNPVVGRSPGLTRAGKDDEQDGDGEVQDPAHDARPTGDERAGALERGRFARRHSAAQIVISQGASAPAST